MDFQDFFTQLLSSISEGVLNFLAALAFLVGGWLVALIAAALVRAGLRRTDLDERLAQAIAGDDPDDPDGAPAIDLEKWIARLVFYVLLLFGVVGFLNQLKLTAVSGPLETLLKRVSEFIPGLIGALVLLVVTWIVARLVKFLVSQVGTRAKLDERLTQQAYDLDRPSLEDGGQISLTKSLATASYWLVFLFFLPAILSQLQLQGLVEPVQNLVGTILLSVPNAFSAGLTLLIGWFIARIVRQVVVNLLQVAGTDRAGQRVGLTGEQSLSKLAGTVVYALIMISTIIAALSELNVEAISVPATAMLAIALDAVPAIFAAILVLALSYLVAKLVAGLVSSLLTGVGFDSLPEKLGLKIDLSRSSETAERTGSSGQRTPSEIAGYLVLVAVMLLAATEAADLLGFTLLAEMVANFTSFGGQVLLALVIFAIGVYLANLARSVIRGAGGQQTTFTANLTRGAIMVFAGAMALRQMGIADEIVNLAFGILLGALGVAAALAFGLGSREIAGREMERWVSSMRSSDASDLDRSS